MGLAAENMVKKGGNVEMTVYQEGVPVEQGIVWL